MKRNLLCHDRIDTYGKSNDTPPELVPMSSSKYSANISTSKLSTSPQKLCCCCDEDDTIPDAEAGAKSGICTLLLYCAMVMIVSISSRLCWCLLLIRIPQRVELLSQPELLSGLFFLKYLKRIKKTIYIYK